MIAALARPVRSAPLEPPWTPSTGLVSARAARRAPSLGAPSGDLFATFRPFRQAGATAPQRRPVSSETAQVGEYFGPLKLPPFPLGRLYFFPVFHQGDPISSTFSTCSSAFSTGATANIP